MENLDNGGIGKEFSRSLLNLEDEEDDWAVIQDSTRDINPRKSSRTISGGFDEDAHRALTQRSDMVEATNATSSTVKQQDLYKEQEPPTNPAEVTHQTSLTELNLNWREQDLPEKRRTKHVHRLHPYLGKFIPQLVEVFLRKYFEPGDTVIDPFCGSGTTLVQANELGINCVGYDISAFNVLLSRAKTQQYDVNRVKFEIQDALRKTRLLTQETKEHQRSLWGTHDGDISISAVSQYLRDWFAERSLRELLTYRKVILSGDYEYTDLLKIILSRSARSARLVRHFDLDFPKEPQRGPYECYKHSKTCTPVQEAFKFIRRYSVDTIKRVKEYSLVRTDATVNVFHENSKTAVFPRADGVITSPPYVGLIDYHEQHVYAYHLLDLEDKRDEEIGPATDGSSMSAKETYQNELAKVFSHAATSLKRGGKMIVVAGDRYDLYDEIAERAGLVVEDIVKRHVNRRTGRRSSEFYESVFVWAKE